MIDVAWRYRNSAPAHFPPALPILPASISTPSPPVDPEPLPNPGFATHHLRGAFRVPANPVQLRGRKIFCLAGPSPAHVLREHSLLQPLVAIAPSPHSPVANAGAAGAQPSTVDIHMNFPARAGLCHIHGGDDVFRCPGLDDHIGRRCIRWLTGFSHHDFRG